MLLICDVKFKRILIITLDFRVQPEHVEQGIKLECTAAIGAVYWQSFQEKIPVIPRLEESTSSKSWFGLTSGASSSSFVQHANVLLGNNPQKLLRNIYIIKYHYVCSKYYYLCFISVRLLVLSSLLPIVILAMLKISTNGLT